MKVLVVDDSSTDRIIIEAFLLELGHEVVACDGGKAALSLFDDDFDLILLDVMMPELPGYEVAKQIRNQYPNDWVPIIFLSARINPADIQKGIDAGGDDYLPKPIDKVILNSKMKAMDRIANMRHELIDVSNKLSSANELLKSMVNQDGLTGLSNRRHLDAVSREFIQLCAIKKTPISIIMADADHFKGYNDHYGHLMGDDCLKEIADTLKTELSAIGHLACRYGGEEFLVVLPNCTLDLSSQLAENIRNSLAQKNIDHSESNYGKVTLSAGLYTAIPSSQTTLAELIEAADEALYVAKHEGRNKICISDKIPAEIIDTVNE